MIRLARTITDLTQALELTQAFLSETSYSQAARASGNIEHLGRILSAIHQQGFIWLAYHDDEPVGILAAACESNLWIPEIHQMREIIWFVRPEYRNTTIGGRLWLKYAEKAEELLEKGRISGYFTTTMTSTRPIDLESRGFELREKIYLKENKNASV